MVQLVQLVQDWFLLPRTLHDEVALVSHLPGVGEEVLLAMFYKLLRVSRKDRYFIGFGTYYTQPLGNASWSMHNYLPDLNLGCFIPRLAADMP